MALRVGKLVLGTFVFSLAWVFIAGRAKRGKGQLPPGPKGLPIIGVSTSNGCLYISFLLILKIIFFRMWLICQRKRNGLHSQNGAVNGVGKYDKSSNIDTHSSLYDSGGILSVKLLGRPMIIINSAAIMEQLDKKGATYSDRPVLEMGGELLGYSQTLVLMRYGARFRKFRKHFSHYIGSPKPIQQLYPLIEHETHRFLKRTLAKPDDLMPHLRKYVSPYSLIIVYDNGYTPKTYGGNNPSIDLWLSSTRR